MKAVRQCQVHTKPRGGDITSKRKDMLANQKQKEENGHCWNIMLMKHTQKKYRLMPLVLTVVGGWVHICPDTCKKSF